MTKESLGKTWPDYYPNSPILHMDKVSTPILIMHNDNDRSVPYAQCLQYFSALRRLQKKAWLMNYSVDGHTISEEVSQLDFTIKQTEFFDYCLKGAPRPAWI